MGNEYLDANQIIEDGVKRLESASFETWWSYIKFWMHELHQNELTNQVIQKVRSELQSEGFNVFALKSGPIDDFELWGKVAVNTLTHLYYTKTPPPQKVVENTDPEFAMLIRGENTFTGPDIPYRKQDILSRANQMLVLPVSICLKRRIESVPMLDAFLDRWVQRTQWFGMPGDDLKEKDYQVDLHRFLFDMGLSPVRSGREAQSAPGGIVDFLLQSKEIVAVELKYWNQNKSLPDIQSWFRQTVRYARDYNLSHAALIIVCDHPSRYIHLSPDLQSKSIMWDEVLVHLRLIDVGRPYASKDTRKAAIVSKSYITQYEEE